MNATVHQLQDPLAALLREAAQLDADIKTKTARLRDLKGQIADAAEKNGKTGKVTAGGYAAKVQQKENVTWDQAKLEQARLAIGNDAFFRTFKWEFKPENKKKLDAFLDYGEPAHVQIVQSAMTVKPGAPSVTIEAVQDGA